MKLSELRIGNYVLASAYGGKEQIWTHFIGQVDAIQSRTHIKVGDGIVWPLQDITGVKLDEGWLHKLGFSRHKPHGFSDELFKLNNFVLIKLPDGYFRTEYVYNTGTQESNHEPFGIAYQFVHQIQNLYFALTAEELTIKDY